MKSLTISPGIILLRQDKVKNEIVSFYKGLLGTAAAHLLAINPSVMRNGPTLDKQHQLKLIEPITKEEVFNALQGIEDSKAP